MAISFAQSAAHADLWVYVDKHGVLHTATTQRNARYQLAFREGDTAPAERERTEVRPLPPAPNDGLGLKAGSPLPALTVPKRSTGLYAREGDWQTREYLLAAARTHQVDYELLKAVVAVESGFNAHAISSEGAIGLMQIMPRTAQHYGVEADSGTRRNEQGQLLAARSVQDKLADPQINIDTGARHLRHLMLQFNGELSLVVAAYHSGEGAVRRIGNQVPDNPQTQNYVKAVLSMYRRSKPAPPAQP
ncbi:MAG: lytic transglycosylase domain-containing protein [Burkholderiaceae bacterium]|nr:lytic transglycosylase domain-containing protein [Burkholderiaceae bacterium]